MNKILQKECKEAAEEDKQKVLALVAALDMLYESMYGDKPTTDK